MTHGWDCFSCFGVCNPLKPTNCRAVAREQRELCRCNLQSNRALRGWALPHLQPWHGERGEEGENGISDQPWPVRDSSSSLKSGKVGTGLFAQATSDRTRGTLHPQFGPGTFSELISFGGCFLSAILCSPPAWQCPKSEELLIILERKSI